MKQSGNALAFLADELVELERRGLRRRPGEPDRPDTLSFCSNDYLGLAETAAPAAPSGAGASRLVAGDRQEHRRAERAFAGWLGLDDALLFPSGYAANVGTVAALAQPGDLIVSDALNHASLIDGARLSRAHVAVVPHNCVEGVDRALSDRRGNEGRAWVLVESYYSMDADGPDLAALRRVCDAHGAALVVDEAHALGVLGPAGRGRCAEAEVRPDVLVGTLGKAFGAQGAFVAGPALLREWLWNKARSFVYSTGLSPASAAAATRSLLRVVEEPDLPERVLRLAERFRRAISNSAVVVAAGDGRPRLVGFGHILPIVLGDPEATMAAAARLRSAGLAVHGVRPPTVPEGTSRLRLTVTARHTEHDVDRAAALLAAELHDRFT